MKTVSAQPGGMRFLIALLLFVALAAPVRFYGFHVGTISSFSVVEPMIVIGLVYVLIKAVWLGRIAVGPWPLFALLALPVVLSMLSMLWTVGHALTVNAILVKSEALFAYIVVINLLHGLDRKKHIDLLLTFAIVLILISVISYPPFSLINPQLPGGKDAPGANAFLVSYYARLSHPFIGLSNNFATILALVAPVTFYVARNLRSKWVMLLTVVLLGMLLATLSRGVILGVTLSVLFVIFAWSAAHGRVSLRALRYGVVLFIGAVIILVAFLVTVPAAMEHIGGRFKINNVQTRLLLYEQAFTAIAERPLLGYGAGVPLRMQPGTSMRSVHDGYLESLYWYGVPLGLLVCAVIVLLPYIVSRLAIMDDMGQGIRRGLVVATLGQALIYLDEASWEGSVLRVIVYAFLGLGVSMVLSSARSTVVQPSE